MAKGDLKGCTEALICSAHEQGLRANYMRFQIDQTAESVLCRMCGSKGVKVANVVRECGNPQSQNIKEGMIMWRGIFIGNFVVNVHCKELVAGMNRTLREWWKVKTSKYCGISQSSATRKLRKEDQTLALPITQRERLS